MDDTSELVYTTYDKALMSGQFAQAAKFDYSQYDSFMKSLILSNSQKEFISFRKKSKDAFDTLIEDLEVVHDRSLSEQKDVFYSEINEAIKKQKVFEEKVITQKEKLLKGRNNYSSRFKLLNTWNDDFTNKKLYKSLNKLFDDSAENGYIFRLESEEKNTKNLKTLKTIGSITIGLSILFSIFISFIIISPLRKLIRTCNEVEVGDYSVRSKIDSRDEFGKLADSMNHMLDTIDKKDQGMETLLSALPYGVFYFDKSGVISKEKSAATNKIFTGFDDFETMSDFFTEYGEDVSNLKDIINTAYSDMLPFDSAVYLLPQRIECEEKIIDLIYKEARGSDKKLERIIIIAKDVTALEKAKKESEMLNQKVEKVAAASNDTPGFKRFISECSELFERVRSLSNKRDENSLSEIRRDLHSLKGMMFIFNFTPVAENIHEIESKIQNDIPEGFLVDVEFSFEFFKKEYNEVKEILGIDFDQRYKYYDSEKVDEIRKLVKEDNHGLYELLKTLDRLPLNKVLAKYFSYAEKLSSSLEDKKFSLVLDEKSEVAAYEIEGLDNSFMHIIRNCIDHGIETIDERTSSNKLEKGTVHISSKRLDNGQIKFIIKDDGKGIDTDFIAQKALEKGIISSEELQLMSDTDKLNLIFAAGFSSNDTVTEMSGRGVGMDVVKSEIEELGGIITLNSIKGIGTQFEIDVPAKLNEV